MTVNDYGFQILRSDGVTQRPMFSWRSLKRDIS
jgi:hypothetical protein